MSTLADAHEYRCVCGQSFHVGTVSAGRLVFCPDCRRPVIAPLQGGGLAERLAVDLASERLDLPLATPGDWRQIFPITSDEKNYDFELSDPDDRQTLVAGLQRSQFPDGFRESGLLTFIARRRCDGVAIGLIHLQVESGHFSGYLGFMIHHLFQRQGYGEEALREVLGFAFGTLNFRRVWSSCDARNVACIKLLGKCGFEHEGVMADAGYHAKRGWIDIPIFSRINRVGA